VCRILTIAGILFLLAGVLPALAAERIVFTRAGETDDAMWNSAKKYFAGKGLSIAAYDQPKSIEKQIETANKINREKAHFMLILEIVASDRSDAFVVVSDVKKAKGLVLNADEVPGTHALRSQELGSSIAARFQKKVKAVPLFMFLGMDLPAVFVRLNVPRESPAETFDKLYDGVLNFTKRGNKDERELKGERRDQAAED
jgi:hypothetical protein